MVLDPSLERAINNSIAYILHLFDFIYPVLNSWILLNSSIIHVIPLQQLRESKREKRAADLVKQDDEVTIKLESAAIERSKSVDSAVLGKYSLWRKEIDNENSDSTVRLIRDQIIMAKVYVSLAKMKNKLHLANELQTRIKESHRSLGEATSDTDLHHR